MTLADREQARTRERKARNLSVLVLVLPAAYLLLAPLVPGLSGWRALTERVPEPTVLRFAVAFLFAYFAALTWDKYRLREITLDLLEAFHMMVYGRDFRKDREAVRLLIRSLLSEREDVRETARGELVRLTGQTFPADHGAWQGWWEANERTFRRRGAAAGAGPREGGGGAPRGSR